MASNPQLPMDDQVPSLIASATQHISLPHESTPEDAQAYESLLASLRKDLQLDPRTELLPPALVDAQGRALVMDSGTGAVTFAGGSDTSGFVVVNHRLGRVPVVAWANCLAGGGGGLASGMGCMEVASLTSTTISVRGQTAGAVEPNGATLTFNWVAIG